MKLIGEGVYNLNTLKEIKVTDSFNGLDKDVRGCQNEEPFQNCTTRRYMDTIIEKCGCRLFHIESSDMVQV